MANYTTINKHTDYFNTKLYTGNGSTQSITGVGFQPDFCWNKNRSVATSHQLFDALRGATKRIYSDSTAAQDTGTNTLTSFDSDGFSVGSGTSANGSGNNIVSWNWKAGDSNTSVSASGSGNGAINACTYRANTTAGFSIVKYTGRNSEISNGQYTKVTHGLGVKPDYIIIKRLGTSESWIVRGGFSPIKSDYHLQLNAEDARNGSFYVGGGDNDDATHFVAGNSGRTNQNGDEYIAYVFASKTGYSKFGAYTGNGQSSDGAFVYTGFKPAFILTKDSSANSWWVITDTTRSTHNITSHVLSSNEANAEASYTYYDILSNGFKARNGSSWVNSSGASYTYMAFGQSLVGSNNIPCTAR